MGREDVIKQIIAAEERFDVDTWKIGDMHLWPLLRVDIAGKLLWTNEVNVYIRPPLKRRLAQRVSLMRTHSTPPWKSCELLFFSRYRDRTVLPGLGNYNRLTGPIEDALDSGVDVLHWESAKDQALVEAPENVSFLEPWMDLARAKRAIDFLGKPTLDSTLEAKIVEMLSYLQVEVCQQRLPGFHYLKKRIHNAYFWSKVFEKWLRDARPKRVAMVCYYSLHGLALVQACKRLSIPCFDIQHGVEGPYHFAYGHWTRVPEGGFSTLPDGFLVWSKSEREALEAFLPSEHRAVVVGNPWLNMWRDPKSRLGLAFDEQVVGELVRANGRRTVLVTLQPDNARDEFRKLLEWMKLLKDEAFFFIRLHYNMVELLDEFKEQGAGLDYVEIAQATRLPLYSWLRHVDVHATGCSTVVSEAALFGVPSVVWHEDALKMFSAEAQDKSMQFVRDASEFREKVMAGERSCIGVAAADKSALKGWFEARGG